MEKEYLTPAELATKLGMSLNWIRKYATQRRIPGQVKNSNQWRFRVVDVEKRLLSGQFLLEKEDRAIGKARHA